MAGPISLQIMSTIELILAQSTHPLEAKDSRTDDSYATCMVHRTLSEPMAVHCTTCGKLYSFEANHDDWKVEGFNDAGISSGELASLGSNAQFIRFHGITITPPLATNLRLEKPQIDDSKHVHSISRKSEIAAVLTHLQKRLGSLQLGSDNWLFASETCRVTTSVANNGHGFPLSSAKKVAFMKVAWQRLFDGMCEPQCITKEAAFNDHIGVYLDEWLMKIKRAPGFQSLAALLHGTRNAGVLDIDEVSAGGSFQFSQQAGTLNPKQILAWQDVCEKIVLRAERAEGTYFAWQFSPEGEYRAPSFTSRTMLRELGVKNSTAKFFQNRHLKIAADDNANLTIALNSVMNEFGQLALSKADAGRGTSRQAAVRESVLAKMKSGAYGRMHEVFVKAVQDVW